MPDNDLAELALTHCDVLLSDLTINPGQLTPTFDSYEDQYTASSTASVVTLTASNVHNSIVQFRDATGADLMDADRSQAGHQVSLASGAITTVRVEVHSQDDLASHAYTIQIRQIAPKPEATRSFSATSVAVGSEMVVTIEAKDYGSFGGVVETLPEGFSYVSSSLPTESATSSGQQVNFALFGETSFTYTVMASDTPGNYTFIGVLKDDVPNDYLVAGDSLITVVEAPSIALTVVGTPLVRINSPTPVTATFSEPVNGFTVDDVSVANGSAGNFGGGDGDSVYTFDVTPNAIGVVTVDIAADVAEDSDGNGNTAAVHLKLGIPYDDDHDGAISREEVITAIGDYLFGGLLTREEVIQIIGLYLFG